MSNIYCPLCFLIYNDEHYSCCPNLACAKKRVMIDISHLVDGHLEELDERQLDALLNAEKALKKGGSDAP